ncbi:GFA family protein [Aspergillus homomorphus CBS 101889]|uniref:CENP-V/GFA domain-containing protein n=1 Tax=Aspergillus homomorphus (strain CBS 101889) TaxID=1450537 RepID=A0A395I141_ASPHC|nr:hypothetical protein BO97DRAFT_404907 [Aspergillus homomorphus CBS 101889]RAL13445.1 hypothetical protein BO97DRAFT_404907 [Aspergillus homomorphus CBS 101889]
MPFPPTPTGESSSHTGTCHCGAVQFHFTISPPLPEYPVNNCNCSICSKNGYLLVYPLTKDFVIDQGEEKLRDYQFGERKVTHQFCGECGSSCFLRLPAAAQGMGFPPISPVNVRLLRDVDIDGLKLNKVDGRAFPPEYKA